MTRKDILNNAGTISHKQALEKAGALYKIEAIKQDLPSEPKTYCRNCGSEVAR